MKNEKLLKAVENLSEVDDRYDDIFELLGIAVDDVADMLKQTNSRNFQKQKHDARDTLKILYRRVQNITFKNKDK